MITELQGKDAKLAEIINALVQAKGALFQKSSRLQYYLDVNGILCRRHKSTRPGRSGRAQKLIVLPETLRETVLFQEHDAKIAGHMGFEKTLDRVKQIYFWEGMYSDIDNYCKSCLSCCEKAKPVQKASVQPMPPVQRPFERVALDVFGSLPTTLVENKFIAVFTDYLT